MSDIDLDALMIHISNKFTYTGEAEKETKH